MRPPWLRPVSGDTGSEVDALQADVMRFVAIIGLSLAAIFSLLQEAEQSEKNNRLQSPDSRQLTAARPEPVTIESPRPTESPSPEPQEGFSLSFSSDATLLQLLAQRSVTIYAIADERFWRYQGPGEMFRESSAPAAYHEMEAATVPAVLRNWTLAAGLPVTRWGVVLPAPTRAELESLMQGRNGGELLIDGEGGVSLYRDAPQR